MSNLKTESLNKCFSLLKEFIEESGNETKRGIAALALDQLRRVTAGKDKDEDPELPIDGGDNTALSDGGRCLTRPKGDEGPVDPLGG